MSQRRPPDYPFIPKSNRSLVAGHFWSIPLADGSFACGRVIQLPEGGSRVLFLAGLLDWRAASPPTCDSIAGSVCLAQGVAHLRLITENGGTIIGLRSLGDDGIEPWMFRGARCWENSWVQNGMIPLRPQRPEDDDLPVIGTWGFGVISTLAEKYLNPIEE